MAEERTNQVVGYPTREIRVTGERSASMVHTTISVSRFEQQLINMSMSSASNMREGVRKAADRFKNALDTFEAELRECQRDLDLATKRKRPTGRRDNAQPAQRIEVQKNQVVSKPQQPAGQGQKVAKGSGPAKAQDGNQTKQKVSADASKQQQPKSGAPQQSGDVKAKPKQAPKTVETTQAASELAATATVKPNEAKQSQPQAEKALPILD